MTCKYVYNLSMGKTPGQARPGQPGGQAPGQAGRAGHPGRSGRRAVCSWQASEMAGNEIKSATRPGDNGWEMENGKWSRKRVRVGEWGAVAMGTAAT